MPSRKTPPISSRKVFLKFLSFVVPGIVLIGALTALTARPAAENPNPKEAARLNSIGVALMNQQLTEKAAAEMKLAQAADPKAGIPVLNRGIPLLNRQKLPEADAELRRAGTMAPADPRVWYNLGLTEM